MSTYLVAYPKPMLYYEQLIVLLDPRRLNWKLLANFENSNAIWNSFTETHDFLVLMDSLRFVFIWEPPAEILWTSERRP